MLLFVTYFIYNTYPVKYRTRLVTVYPNAI